MTAGDINLVLSGVASVLAAGSWLSTCILSKRNSRKIEANTASSLANGDRLDRAHAQINSRMTELIDMNRKDATAIEKQRGIDSYPDGTPK